ncbi:unnamed protein product [Microthlaspi erraticum]|uniref:Arabidopsis retrotransposon Orf1 C-terminal domain-containing protein n=1 Tax=Microthlaspi erraticum TaxID=1685480 RepID=A0A6D2KFX7_9BRAS|nr:unnamed protein product [Microthlaspi erraticum]
MTQRMEESDAEEGGNGSPEEGSDETESEEEGEEVNQLVEESNQDEPWRRLSQRGAQEEEKLPMYQEHYNALFSMDFVETKYPHVDTMKALGIFEDVELSQEHALGQVFSYHMESYKELTCEFFGFNEAVGDLFGFNYGEGYQVELQGKELQRVWATIADGGTLPQGPRLLKSGAQCLRYVHKALANTFFARKAPGPSTRGNSSFLTWESSPSLTHKDGKRIKGDRSDTGNLMPSLTISSPTRHSLQH